MSSTETNGHRTIEFIALYGGSGTGKDEMAKAIIGAANESRPGSATLFSTSNVLDEIENLQSTYPHIDELRAIVGEDIKLKSQGIYLPAAKIHAVAERSIVLLADAGFEMIVSPSYPRDLEQRQGLDLILDALRSSGYNPQLMQAFLEATPDLMRHRMMVVRPAMLQALGLPVRTDDVDPGSVDNRIKEFFTKTEPVVSREIKAGRIVRFDASEDLAVVQAQAIATFVARSQLNGVSS